MAPDGIVEPVDVAANGLVGFLAGVEDGPPDELGFQGLEERFHHGVVVAIPLPVVEVWMPCLRSSADSRSSNTGCRDPNGGSAVVPDSCSPGLCA